MASYALLATINHYANESLPRLQFAERDGQVLEARLRERGFKTRHLAGPDATRERILHTLCGDVAYTQWPPLTAEDLLLFFFAGHGELVGGTYVLHGYNAQPGTLIHSVPMRDVAHALRQQIPCQQCACIVDACRNLARPGARGANVLDEQSTRDIKAVASAASDSKLVEMLYGCDEGQVSMEDPSLQHGVLTYHIAQAILEHDCATMEDLFDEAADRMRAWLRKHGPGQVQEPQLYRPGGRRRISLFGSQIEKDRDANERADGKAAAERQEHERATAEKLTREAMLSQLRQEVATAIGAEEWELAEHACGQILELQPNDPWVLQSLKTIAIGRADAEPERRRISAQLEKKRKEAKRAQEAAEERATAEQFVRQCAELSGASSSWRGFLASVRRRVSATVMSDADIGNILKDHRRRRRNR